MEIIFFNKRTKKFFNSVDPVFQSRMRKAFAALEKYHVYATMPLSKPIGRGLFELRIVGLQQLRFIYTFHSQKILVLHGFLKKTNRIPKNDLEYARKQQNLLAQV